MLKKYISLKLAANILMLAIAILLVSQIVALFFYGSAESSNAGTGTRFMLRQVGAVILYLLMTLMIAIRVDYLNVPKLKGFSQTAMWVIFVYFFLMTIQIFSVTVTTAILIHTLLTALMTAFAYRLAMREDPGS